MTTNIPDELDTALIRPGRIDINIKFGYMTNKALKEMFEYFYREPGRPVPNYKFDESFTDKFSPAEVSQILGNYYNNHEEAYKKLCQDKETIKHKYY